MTERQLTIGLVEDNPGDARLIRKMLGEPQAVPFRVDSLSRLDETLDRVGREPFDVLLLDLGLPDSQGLTTFDRVTRQAPTMPIIIFSGDIDEQLAVEAVARGAQDYLVKGRIDSLLLKRAIRYAIERKRAEQDLRERERALLEQNVELERREREGQRYLDTAEVILLALDLEGRISLVNRYACAILGWTADDLRGRDWIETCLPARLKVASRKTFRNLLAGDLSIVENPVLTRSGGERLIAWRNTLLRDDAGHVVGTFSSGSDITERKRAEEEIRDGAERSALAAQEFRTLFAANPLPMWIYDPTTLQFLEVNDAAVRRYGYVRDEFLAMTIRDIRPPEDVERLLADVGQSREAWQDAGGWRHRLKSGQIIDVDITSHTIAFAGRSAALVVAQDITERKRAEEMLSQRAQLSALRAAMGLSLADTDSLTHALQRCAEALVTHLGAALARIWTLNERDGVLELQASAGLYTHVSGPQGTVPLGEFEIGRIAQDGKPHLTNTVVADPQVHDREWARREGIVAFAGYPLIVGGRIVGVMALYARHALTDATVEALASVPSHIAVGIERHWGANALRTAEERMRFALQNANVGIWDMDFTTGVTRWSESLEAQHGLQPGTFGGTFEAFVGRIHPDDRASVLETVGRARKSGADFSMQVRTVWPDGTVRWLRSAGRVHLGENGEPVRAVGISLDVTERERAQSEFARLNDEIQRQRLRVFKATMTTVQDIVNNLLNGFQFVRLEAEGQLPAAMLTLIDQMIQEASLKLKTLGDLETVEEKGMAMGLGIDYPGSAS
jgi:PAS domain S-box-containing protein